MTTVTDTKPADMLQWLQDNGATSPTIPDAWLEVLAIQGFTGARSDSWYSLLDSLAPAEVGRSLSDLSTWFWVENGGELVINLWTNPANPIFGWVWDGDVTYTGTGAFGQMSTNGTGLVVVPGVTYRVTYTVAVASTGVLPDYNFGGPTTRPISNVPGIYSAVITASTNGPLAFNYSGTYDGSLSDITLEIVDVISLLGHLAAQPRQDAILETESFPWFQGDNFGPLNEAVDVSESMDGDETVYEVIDGDYGIQAKLHLTASPQNGPSIQSFDNAGGSSITAEVWGGEDVLVAGYSDNLTTQRAGAQLIAIGLKPYHSNWQFATMSVVIYKAAANGHSIGDVVLEIALQINEPGPGAARTDVPLDITTSDRDTGGLGVHFWETVLATGYTGFDAAFWFSILFKSERVAGECMVDVETSFSGKQTIGYTENPGGIYSEPVVGFRVSDFGVTSLACWTFNPDAPNNIRSLIAAQVAAWRSSQYDITISDDTVDYNAMRCGDFVGFQWGFGVSPALGALQNPTLNGLTIKSLICNEVAISTGGLPEAAYRTDLIVEGDLPEDAMPEKLYINGVLYSQLDYGFDGTPGTQAESGHYTTGGGSLTHWAWVIVDSNSPDRSVKTFGVLDGTDPGTHWIPLSVKE